MNFTAVSRASAWTRVYYSLPFPFLLFHRTVTSNQHAKTVPCGIDMRSLSRWFKSGILWMSHTPVDICRNVLALDCRDRASLLTAFYACFRRCVITLNWFQDREVYDTTAVYACVVLTWAWRETVDNSHLECDCWLAEPYTHVTWSCHVVVRDSIWKLLLVFGQVRRSCLGGIWAIFARSARKPSLVFVALLTHDVRAMVKTAACSRVDVCGKIIVFDLSQLRGRTWRQGNSVREPWRHLWTACV